MATDLFVVNLATGQSSTMAPLGALYVVAAAEQAGYQVAFRDYALETGMDLFNLDRIAQFLSEDESPLLGVSCFASMLPYALGALERFRQSNPKVKIILGGPGPSALASQILHCFPAIDFVVSGEGEETVVELLSSLRTGDPPLASIAGLAWRSSDGAVNKNLPRIRRRDLDAIPFPAYHRVRLEDYDVVGVVYSRGCPYACTYCDVVSMWKRQNIARSLENVLSEIMWLKQCHGVRHIAFVDDLFTVDRKRTLQFCEGFGKAGLPTSWGCTTRIDRVDNELLEWMAGAGCNYVFYGIESGSKKILARVNKVIPFEQTVQAIRTSVRLGMYVHAPLMWGFPFEEMGDFQETVVFGRYLEHCKAQVFYTLATPLPATALYEEFRHRLCFNPDIYSTIIAPGRMTDLSEVKGMICEYPQLFPGFYHFADGLVEEKISIGRKLGLNLADIRISQLTGQESAYSQVPHQIYGG
jgi:anaerobic magnesium-protoporphyrin IX monomethyl ester cyclase